MFCRLYWQWGTKKHGGTWQNEDGGDARFRQELHTSSHAVFEPSLSRSLMTTYLAEAKFSPPFAFCQILNEWVSLAKILIIVKALKA